MKRGRKPKPRALRALEGGRQTSHRPLPPDIRPQLECDMPPHLEGEAAKEWARAFPELARLGLATGLDRAALAGYCQSWSRWVEAERALRRYGAIVKAPTGFPMLSPYLHVANIALKQIREFAAEFGMSPSSRSRVDVEQIPAPLQPPSPSGPRPRRFFPE